MVGIGTGAGVLAENVWVLMVETVGVMARLTESTICAGVCQYSELEEALL